MRVRRADGHTFGSDVPGLLKSPGHFIPNGRGHAAVIHGNENSWPLPVTADGQRLGPKMLGHAFGLGLAHRVARETNRVCWSDVNFCDTSLPDLFTPHSQQ